MNPSKVWRQQPDRPPAMQLALFPENSGNRINGLADWIPAQGYGARRKQMVRELRSMR